MIEFTDTVIYQIDNAISVSLRAVGNSLDGGLFVMGRAYDRKNLIVVSGKPYNRNPDCVRIPPRKTRTVPLKS